MSKDTYEWIPFYKEFADRLLPYKNKRQELIGILLDIFKKIGMNYPFMDNGEPGEDICPFTVFGSFNKGITDDNRKSIMRELGARIGVHADIPDTFDGVPVLNNMKSWFFGYKQDRGSDDIQHLWELFEAAIAYAENERSAIHQEQFITAYDKVMGQLGVKWNITMGLYWIRPYMYLNLDARNREYLLGDRNPWADRLRAVSEIRQLPDARGYLAIIALCSSMLREQDTPSTFPELSQEAWKNGQTSNASFLKWFAPLISALKQLGGHGSPEQVRQQIIKDEELPDEVVEERRGKTDVKKFDNEVAFARNYLTYDGYLEKGERGIWKLSDKGWTEPMNESLAADIFRRWAQHHKERREESVPKQRERRVWIYAPGNQSSEWESFYREGIMGIGWDEMGDLGQYANKTAMRDKMKELYGSEKSYRNDVHATWQFADEVKIGDIVFVKKGNYKVIGRGVVESEYQFDDSRNSYQHVHQMRWTHAEEVDSPVQNPQKTLTDMSAYKEVVQKLEDLYQVDEPVEVSAELEYPSYAEEDFLSEVFMDYDQYMKLSRLLKMKKNLILQGAPGVGKTFAAKRLAYAMMGECDDSRILMVQFHQSYSYEDFIMGYRPTSDGFELRTGPFYQFCKKAAEDDEREYYFIIDEINRGNLSKIFGELLMLIEKDKRGQSLRLLYQDEYFNVPVNVHIIGMMNTADRSLAMIDYALRRRFAFYEIEPAFDSDGFQSMLVEQSHPKLEKLVKQVKELNHAISKDESLGQGFRVGHSYLCTSEEVTDEWLELVIHYELIPLLNEYWFDEGDKVAYWSKQLLGAIHD